MRVVGCTFWGGGVVEKLGFFVGSGIYNQRGNDREEKKLVQRKLGIFIYFFSVIIF